MSDDSEPRLHPVDEGRWFACLGPWERSHLKIGEVTAQGDGAYLARDHNGVERGVGSPEEGLTFIVQHYPL